MYEEIKQERDSEGAILKRFDMRERSPARPDPEADPKRKLHNSRGQSEVKKAVVRRICIIGPCYVGTNSGDSYTEKRRGDDTLNSLRPKFFTTGFLCATPGIIR